MDDTIFELLNCFSERSSLSAEKLAAIYNTDYLDYGEPLSLMLKNGYLIKDDPLEKYPDDFIYPECHYRITFEGRAALSMEKSNRNRFKYGEIRAWLTLLIALAAFIKSFFY